MIARMLGKTMSEIDKMPASEMSEWMAFMNMERKAQQGPPSLDERAAALARTM